MCESLQLAMCESLDFAINVYKLQSFYIYIDNFL